MNIAVLGQYNVNASNGANEPSFCKVCDLHFIDLCF